MTLKTDYKPNCPWVTVSQRIWTLNVCSREESLATSCTRNGREASREEGEGLSYSVHCSATLAPSLFLQGCPGLPDPAGSQDPVPHLPPSFLTPLGIVLF